MNASLIAVTHQLQDAVVGLRVVFSICLVAVILAGLYVIKKRRELFGRDPHVTADTWASRNLRLMYEVNPCLYFFVVPKCPVCSICAAPWPCWRRRCANNPPAR